MKKFILFFFLSFIFYQASAYTYVTQKKWRWRNDNGSETSATWKAAENQQVKIQSVNENLRLRMQFLEEWNNQNAYNNSTVLSNELRYSTNPNGPFTAITASNAGSKHFILAASSFVSSGNATTNQLSLASAEERFDPGTIMTAATPSGNISFNNPSPPPAPNLVKEIEWVIKPTEFALKGVYYFRLGDGSKGGSSGNLTYSNNISYDTALPSIEFDPVVIPAPEITTQPVAATIVGGQNTSFTVAASGEGSITYQWQVSKDNGTSFSNLTDGLGYSGATTATLSVAKAPISLTGNQYRVQVSNGTIASSNAVALTVNQLPFDNGGVWQVTGAAGFSAGEVEYTSLVLDRNGTPYVAYRDYGNGFKATVMKFNGTAWEAVGTPGFSAGAVGYISLALDASGKPYVAYRDGGNISKATVMKFNGTSWVPVGTPGFSAGWANYTSLVVDNSGIPYIAYSDNNNGSKVTVMKFNGTNWVPVGQAGFSAGAASFISLALDGSSTPYVAYLDYGNGNKATVMKFNGTNWVPVGQIGFSAGQAQYTSLVFDASGTPFVAYMDGSRVNKATVMKFNGNSWVPVGQAGFSAGTAFFTSLALDGSGTPYVAYTDGVSTATVMKLDGNSWVPVGNVGLSAGMVNYTSLALDANGMPYVAYQDGGKGNKATVMKYINDEIAPTITGVSLPANQTYKAGDNLDFTFTFSENIISTRSNANLDLTIGATARTAAYQSATANSITYRYTIQAGDLDTDGIAVGVISLNDATIKDGAGNNADLTFTPATTAGIQVEGTIPAIASVSIPEGLNNLKLGDQLDITINFTEDIVVTGTPALGFAIGNHNRAFTYVNQNETAGMVFRYTVGEGDLYTGPIFGGQLVLIPNSGTLQDAAGNNANLDASHLAFNGSISIDGVVPTITSVDVPATGNYKADQELNFTVNFSEEVTVTGNPVLPLTIGTTNREAAYVSGSGTKSLLFSYKIQAGEMDTDGIAVGTTLVVADASIKDAAGNNASLTLTHIGNTNRVYVDTVVPTVTLSSQTPASLNTPFSVTLTFSEPITGLNDADITVANGVASGLLSQDNQVYTVNITPTADGEVKVSVAADVAQDAAQNSNLVSNELTRIYDATMPTVAINTTATTWVNAPFTATFSFSEPVREFRLGDLVLTNATAAAFTAVSASEYTALITPSNPGEVTVAVPAEVAQDGAGNPNLAATDLKLTYDREAPAGYAVTFKEEKIDFGNQANVTVQVTGVEVETPYTYTITSSAGGTPVSGTGTSAVADFEIPALDVSGLADGTLTVTFYQQDAAGNKGAEETASVEKLTRNIVAVTSPATLVVPIRTTYAQLSLPATVEVTYSDNTKQAIAVSWQEGAYNGMVAGSYELTGTLTLAPGTANQQNRSARIMVEVEPNKVPTALTLSKTTFSPNIAATEAVGTFATTDADDTQHTYALVNGQGNTDNNLFEIRGNALYLKSNGGLSGKTQFSIRVSSTDVYNNTFEQTFTLSKGQYAKAVADLKIVNTFTPNNDGTNDTWTIPELKFYNQVEVEVFDRSGVRLFRTTDPEKGWDGKDQNGQVRKGSFLYVVQVKDINLVKKGVVTILKK